MHYLAMLLALFAGHAQPAIKLAPQPAIDSVAVAHPAAQPVCKKPPHLPKTCTY